MATPQFIEEKSLSLIDIKEVFKKIEKRDKEMNYLSNKSKEYLDQFVKLSLPKKEELHQKLAALNLTRLKNEHIAKLIDFLPATADEVKVVLQGYHMSLPKKDAEAIVGVVKEFV